MLMRIKQSDGPNKPPIAIPIPTSIPISRSTIIGKYECIKGSTRTETVSETLTIDAADQG